MPEMKLPGPDHPITIAANPHRVAVRFGDHEIGKSDRVLTLREAGYKAVQYFPREDVAMEFFSRSDRVTYCPYKGEAHYYSLFMDGRLAENLVWTYEEPYPAMDAIRGYLAFYPNQVEIYEIADGAERALSPDEVIQHTDAGDGASQKDHWPPNAGVPHSPG